MAGITHAAGIQRMVYLCIYVCVYGLVLTSFVYVMAGVAHREELFSARHMENTRSKGTFSFYLGHIFSHASTQASPISPPYLSHILPYLPPLSPVLQMREIGPPMMVVSLETIERLGKYISRAAVKCVSRKLVVYLV